MILRDSRIAEQRCALPALPVEQRPVPRDAPVDRRVDTKAEMRSDIGASKAVAPSLPKEPELTFESVVAWLAVQDEQTRKACASILSPEVTQVHETAKADGFSTGHAAGLAAAAAENKDFMRLLRELSESLESAYVDERTQLEEICVEVISEAFAKIAGQLLQTEEAAIGAVREVLDRVRDEREVTIRVARAQLALLHAHEDELTEILNGRRFQIVADSRVELGGCIVESKTGNYDGRLEVQLRELYETLKLARAPRAESA